MSRDGYTIVNADEHHDLGRALILCDAEVKDGRTIDLVLASTVSEMSRVVSCDIELPAMVVLGCDDGRDGFPLTLIGAVSKGRYSRDYLATLHSVRLWEPRRWTMVYLISDYYC